MAAVQLWLQQKVAQPLRDMTPLQRTECLALGILGGLFPIPGVTTPVTMMLCAAMGCTKSQIAVATAINLMLTAAQIPMIPWFATVAAMFSGYPAEQFSVAVIVDTMSAGVVGVLRAAFVMLVHACVSWATATGIVVALLFRWRSRETKLR